MGKRISYLVLFMLMLLSSGVADASNTVLEKSYYYTCTPNGNGSFHFRFPIFSRATFNHFIGSYADITKDETYKKNTYLLMTVDGESKHVANFAAENFSSVETKKSKRRVYLHMIKDMGQIVGQGEVFENTGSQGVDHFDSEYAVEEDGNPTLFIQFDYFPKGVGDGKMVKFTLHVADYSYWDFEQELKFELGEYSFNNSLRQPSLLEPYINMDATPEDQGSMVVNWTAIKDVENYKVITVTDGVADTVLKKQAVAAPNGEFIVKQSNKQRTVYISAEMFADNDKKIKVWVNSNTVCVKSYQELNGEFTSENNKQNNNGYSELKWDINYPSNNEYISTDGYVVKRAYSSDFKNATTLGSIYSRTPSSTQTEEYDDKGEVQTRVKQNTYTFVDSTFGCAFNPNDLSSKDTMLVFAYSDPVNYGPEYTKEFYNAKIRGTGSELELKKELFSYITVPKRVVYYSVEKATATSLWDQVSPKFRKTDSVYKFQQLPLISVAEAEKDRYSWSNQKKVNLRFFLNNYRIKELPCYKELSSRQAFLSRDILNLYPHKLFSWDPNASINVLKINRETGDTTVIKISGDKVLLNKADSSYYYAELEDYIGDGFAHYSYKAVIDASNSYFPINERGLQAVDIKIPADSFYYEDLAKVTNLEATRNNPNYVKVTWERTAGPFSAYRVLRRIYSGGKYVDEFMQLEDSTANYLYDKTIGVGQDAYYHVFVVYYHNNQTIITKNDIQRCRGGRGKDGKIHGKVVTASGISMADVKVCAVNMNTNDSIITNTNADGTYTLTCENVSSGALFNVAVIGKQSEGFVTDNGQNSYSITLSEEKMEYFDANFSCKNVKIFAGRVLYVNTTVPVKDAHFMVNGKYVFNKDGSLLSTDSYGNFAFEVPEARGTFQVVKDGHKFSNDGYIHDNTDAHDTVFAPTNDYKGLILYDSTKVRMAGRIAAGKEQAELPLGFGLSKNYIGDSLTIVMQLEGDETALLVYDTKKKNLTMDETVVYHPGDSSKTTFVKTERKRLTIKPDPNTGEFFVDLLPVKYKMTQMYAEGYSNLLGANEAAQIVDLSYDSLIKANEYTYQFDQLHKRTISYNTSFIREYHAPVELSYRQISYGLESEKLGETTIVSTNIFGETKSFDLLKEEKGTNAISYTFGHPVFTENSSYGFYVYAQEAYYYNGKKNSKDSVYYAVVPNGVLTINNGLTKDKKPTSIQMNEKGVATFTFIASNPTFSLTEEDALRYLNMEVAVDGYYYKAEPLAAFVTGRRAKGTDIFTQHGADIKLLDVLRDPPGAYSYSYLEKGTKYTINRSTHFNIKLGLNLDIKKGTNYKAVVGTVTSTPGTFFGQIQTGQTDFQTQVDLVFLDHTVDRNATYQYELAERIETSSDPNHIGAMADVFVGLTDNMTIGKNDVVSIIDAKTYRQIEPAIATNDVKVIASSINTKEDTAYIVVAEEISYKYQLPSTFIYTQEHIIKNVIPNLIRERNSLIRHMSKSDAEKLASDNNIVVYYTEENAEDADFGQVGYEIADPNGVNTNAIEDIDNQILKWLDILADNEEKKAKTISRKIKSGKSEEIKPVIEQSFSISGGTKVNWEESDEQWDSENDPSNYFWTTLWQDNAKGNVNSLFTSPASLGTDKLNDDVFKKWLGSDSLNDALKAIVDTAFKKKDSEEATQKAKTTIEGAAAKWSIEIAPIFNIEGNSDFDDKAYSKRKMGFSLKSNDRDYLEISVLAQPIDSVSGDTMSKYYDFISNGKGLTKEQYLHNYVFYLAGGATCDPYEAPDSTLLWMPGSPLAATTLKIDNPQIEVTTPVLSNVPQDQKAIFNLKLINASESTNAIQAGLSSNFKLKMNDATNPSGAKVYMDGEAITDGRTFTIPCGGYINKTIEVERGVGFNVENLGLVFSTTRGELNDKAYVSVNYLPTSSPIEIVLPKDKWVMNTLSQHDSIGYFIPVEVSGFNTHYDNFDHIEVQYKESNKGEDAWVNLCSYFTDQDLFNKATGNKEMLTSGTIKLPFYGGKDPMEMKYDIRAVSFCRLGTAYVSRYSEVVSGIKDTRCPRVFGIPEPTDGILSYGDVIKLPFTEPIAYNYLDKTSNFEIVGYKNNTSLSEKTALVFAGNENQKAVTEVNRNLVEHNFTIDMMVRANHAGKDMTFFSHGDKINNLTFGVNSENKLTATINGQVFVSEQVGPLTDKLNRVGMMVNNGTGKVTFFMGNQLLAMETVNDTLDNPYKGDGPVYIGSDLNNGKENLFAGSMLEVRVWADTLTAEELSAYNCKQLNGYESHLIAHYPLTETQGKIAHEEVNGANLILENTTWNTKRTHSLKTMGKPVKLDPMKTQTNSTSDYSMMFWFKSSEKLDKNTESLAIFTAGGDRIPEVGKNKLFIGYEGDKLVVRSNGVSNSLGNTYTDAEWHHFAMTVSRSKNAANIYIDGNLVSQLSGSAIGGIASDYAAFGNDKMDFNFDLFTLWDLALPNGYISKHFNEIPEETEKSIRVYLPFDHDVESDQGTTENVFSPFNEKREYDTNVDIYAEKDSLLLNVSEEANDDKDNSAPIAKTTVLSKIDFDWSSTDQSLLIQLLENDKDINYNEIFITVKNVEDLNGNLMTSPEMWSIYTSLNQLYFSQKEMLVKADYEEEGPMVLTMINKSGSYRNYKIYNSTEWLVPEETMGTIEPNTEQVVNFTIKGINDPGEYFDIVYLEDENGLVSSCVVNLVVSGTKPDYSVDKSAFDYTMTYKGQVMVKTANGNQIIDNNKNDIVYAFINDKCVGKSNIEVADNGKAYVYMTIYGTAENDDNSDVISFRMWNSTTGKITAMSSISAPVHFLKDGQLGCGSKSDTLYEAATKINSLHLNKGWNWISVNVKPTAGRKCIANMFVSSYTPFSSGDIIKSPTRYDEYSAEHKTWTNNIKQIGNDTVYLVKVENDGIYNIIGEELGDDTVKIKGNQWSHLPYLLNATTPINTALADLQKGEGAQPGDMVKSLTSFAFLSEDHVWEGDLKYLKAGEGYFIKLQNGMTRSIIYHKKSAGTKSRKVANEVEAENNTVATHANNMPVIAKFAEGVEYNENDKLVAYANGEKAGEAALKNINGNDMFLLSVNAEDGDAIVFAQVRDGETIATTKSAVKYDANGVLGSSQSPYEITFTNDFFKASPTLFTEDVTFSYNSTNDAEGYIKVYATDGSLVWSTELKGNTQSVVNMNGSHLASGVYYAVAKMGDAVETIKIIKE